jgi:hypothetical protein
MKGYRLQYLDPSGKFIRADRIHGDCDPDAIDAACGRRLPVRSELWRGSRLVAKIRPAAPRARTAAGSAR